MTSTPIPADVEREDRLLAGLTARQLVIVTGTILVAWPLLTALSRLVPMPLAAVLISPVVMLGAVLTFGSMDGLSMDRLLLAALRERLSPRRRVLAPEGVAPAPAWLAGHDRNPPVPLDPPLRGVDADGIIDLGADGSALVCRASAVSFGLRTAAEQAALVANFARFLDAVTAPVQVVVRAQRADLAGIAAALGEAAGGLPHPALEQAARDHSAFLSSLAERRDVLHHEILLVFRDRAAPADAAGLLRRRAEEAASLLAPAGISVTVLDGGTAAVTLARAADPESPPRSPLLAEPGATITGDLEAYGQRTTPRATPPPGPRRWWPPRPRPVLPAPPAGLPVPDAIEILGPRTLRVCGALCRTLAVTGYPREVGPGWLEPLLTYPGSVDVALHIDPIPNPVAAERLRRQLARLESTRRLDADRRRLADFEAEAAAEDAHELARRLARGEGRLYRVGLYLTVRGRDETELDAETARLRALLGSLLLDAHPTTFRTLQGWTSTLPLGLDLLRLRRTFDTRALAASFPFVGGLGGTDGVLYGRNPRSQDLLFWDRFSQPNHNSVILARSGAGKSYLAKLETLRWLYHGVEVSIIDPEDEYRRLADAVGGAHLRLGAAGVRLNPFDLDQATGPDALTRRALFIHTLIAVLLGSPLDPAATAALDRAVLAAYAARGISTDPRTHTRPAPLLADLAAALDHDPDPAARTLAARLAPFVTGTHRELFAGPTSTRPDGHLVVFSLRDLPEELTAAGTLLALDTVWRRVTDPARRRRRLVVVDEAWLLLRDPAGARFLYRLAKSARKHWCGLTTITQDAADLLGTELGQAVVNNATTQLLLGQAPQAIDALSRAFRLSDGERAFLLAARQGEGILVTGRERAALAVVASDAEHRLATTGPEFRDLDGSDREAHR